MRVGIDAHMIGDHSGGNESFYRGILGALKPDKGDEYYIFLNPGVDGSIYKDKFHVVHYKSGSTMRRYLIELPLLCRQFNLDVLHTQYYIPIIRPCPVAVLIHDISYERLKDMFTKSEMLRNRILIPYAARKAKKVITVSEFSKKEIVDLYKIDTNKIKVVYNAVDEAFTTLNDEQLKRSEVRNKFNIGDNPYIICVANLQPRKNIPRLIDAYLKYRKEHHTDLKLVLVGKKAWLYDASINAAARDDDNIILTDYVEKDDLVALLNEANGLFYPSIYEGFGIPPLEALMCGIPVAVSDIPVMHEVVGGNAIYFDPYDVDSIKDAICRFDVEKASSVDNSKQITSIRKTVTERFDWEKSSEDLKNIYRKCIE